jgi:hypothetical protein
MTHIKNALIAAESDGRLSGHTIGGIGGRGRLLRPVLHKHPI